MFHPKYLYDDKVLFKPHVQLRLLLGPNVKYCQQPVLWTFTTNYCEQIVQKF
jgi:hypothetical protein